MSKRTDSQFLNDIQEAIQRLAEYVADMEYEDFLEDRKTQDAVLRNLEIIGEATKRISYELRSEYVTIPWKSMAGVRDKLVHDYFGVNIDVVWSIVSDELPPVGIEIEQILVALDERTGGTNGEVAS